MLKEILETVKKNETLDLEYGIASARKSYYNDDMSVLIYRLDKFIELSRNKEVTYEDRPCKKRPVEASYFEEFNGTRFKMFMVMTHLDYLAHEKSRAKNTTKEKVL